MGAGLTDFEKGGFDLRGKDVDAADDQHIIRPALKAGDTGGSPATGTGFVSDGGQVFGSVAQQRNAFFGQCSQNQLADFTVRQNFQCVRINNLSIKVVVHDMAALVLIAVLSHPRSHNLTQTVDVKKLNTQPIFYLLAQLDSPRLAAANGHPQLEQVFQLVFFDVLHHMSQIRGCTGNGSSSQINHEIQLPARIAC